MKLYLIAMLGMMIGCSVSAGEESHCTEGNGGADAGIHSCAIEMHAHMAEDASHECVFKSCELLWGDCDNNLSNGCETILSMDSACGACGVVCQAGTQCVTECDQPGTTCFTKCK